MVGQNGMVETTGKEKGGKKLDYYSKIFMSLNKKTRCYYQ
jgi:hypothetical protein